MLGEQILEGASLHTNVERKPTSERRRSGIAFEESDVDLIRSAG
jgi:hypothetical protein